MSTSKGRQKQKGNPPPENVLPATSGVKSAAQGGESEDEPPAATVAVPLPPGAQGPSTNFSVQMALLAQPNSLAQLPAEVRKQLLENADRADERGFQHAQAALESDERLRLEELKSDGSRFTFTLKVVAGFLGFLLLSALIVILVLVWTGNAALAMEIFKKGMEVAVILLGGASIKSGADWLFGKKKRD